MVYLVQGLPFHSTIVQREFTHIPYAFLFSCRSDFDKHTCWRMLYNFFSMFTLEKYFMVE